METTDLRTEFTKETKTRFNSEWIAYNDYAAWLEQRLVKLLTIPPVVKSVCDDCTAYPFYERGKTPLCKTCKDNPSQTVL
jgi:hypothetical protein